jgi:hypothetical protein
MTVIEDRLAILGGIHLGKGKHHSFAEGVCAMELAAWLAGEPHSDRPLCVDPVIAAFLRTWQDQLDDDARDVLVKPLVPFTIGTANGPELQDKRAFLAADWAVRVFTPAWLRLAGLEENAAELEGLKALASVALCNEARPAIDRARAAARDAARAAARAAARDAAGDAAGAAAWDAARDAARAAARDAARDAAGAAAGAAAWDAAGAAARAAARDALAPTVEQLQQSAVDLVTRMCEATA